MIFPENEVIKEANLGDLSEFDKPPGELEVSLAGRGIAGQKRIVAKVTNLLAT